MSHKCILEYTGGLFVGRTSIRFISGLFIMFTNYKRQYKQIEYWSRFVPFPSILRDWIFTKASTTHYFLRMRMTKVKIHSIIKFKIY